MGPTNFQLTKILNSTFSIFSKFNDLIFMKQILLKMKVLNFDILFNE